MDQPKETQAMKRPKPAPAFTLRPGESITFTLPVTPRTKKNSRTHVRKRAKTGNMITVPLPSEAYKTMEAQIVAWANDIPGNVLVGCVVWCACEFELAQPLNCSAIFYRDADRGDAVGYYQGLADALEAAGVVADDKWIKQWDGSRLAKDAKLSRIEVTLTAI
jgi:Holliday junction resolvase RusA-like endonuclease